MAMAALRFSFWHWQRVLFVLAATLSALGVIVSVLPFLLGMGAQGTLFELVGGFAVGVGLSLLQIEWGVAFFAKSSQKDSLFVTATSFLVSLPISYLFIDTGPAGLAIALAAPFVSAILLQRQIGVSRIVEADESVHANAEEHSRQIGGTKTTRKTARLAVLMLLTVWFGLAFGIFRMTLLPEGVIFTSLSMHNTVLVCLFIGIVIVVTSLCFSDESYLPLVLVVSLFFVTLGIFALSFSGVGGNGMITAFTTGGVKCAEIVTWVIAISLVSNRSGRYATCVFGVWRAAGCAGALLGYILSRWLTSAVALDATTSLSLSLFILLTLVVVSFVGIVVFRGRGGSFRVNSDEEDFLEGLDQGCFSRDKRMQEISSSAGLSQRESEVFKLLCSGRTAPFIAEKLVIAESTVNTHVKRIYRKLGIHSRQELIDLIDS